MENDFFFNQNNNKMRKINILFEFKLKLVLFIENFVNI